MTLRNHRAGLGLGLCAALVLAGCGDDQQAAAPEEGPALQDAVAYVGRWAAEPAWCARGGEDRTITLAPSRLEGHENLCEMEVEQEADEVWRAQLDCRGEGMRSEERIRLALQEHEVLTLTWLDRDGAEVTLQRCPEPGSDAG